MLLILYIFAVTYAGVAIFAVIMTYAESIKNSDKSKVFTVVGALLCLVWPVMIVAILISQKYTSFNQHRLNHSNG